MDIIKTITDAIKKEGHVTKLADTFEEHNIDLPTAIQIHYAGINGIDEDRMVIRKQNNEHTGDVILRVEYNGVHDEWVLSKPNTTKQIAVIDGQNNYIQIANKIQDYMQNNF